MTHAIAESPTTSPGRTSGDSHQPVPLENIPSVPFHRLVRVELRKIVDTRAGVWMLGVMAAASVLVTAGLLIWGDTAGMVYLDFLGIAAVPMVMILPILGVMAATSEWAQRTGLVTFALEPRRGRVVAAKILAGVVLGLIVIAVGFAAAAIGTAIAGGGVGELSATIVAGMLAALLIYIVQGFAFGFLFLNTPIAIISVLALPTLWGMLTSMIGALDRVGGWLNLDRTLEPLFSGTMPGEGWLRALVATTVWLGIPLAVGTYRVLTREVK